MSETAGRHQSSSRATSHARRRSILGVGVTVALLVLVNSLVHQTRVEAVGDGYAASPPLSVVQLSEPSDWLCPGPLPVGKGKESSRISIVNGARSVVIVLATISRVEYPHGSSAGTESTSRIQLDVRARSQSVLPLPAVGPAGFAAVALEAEAGGIGVSESVIDGSSKAGVVLLSSVCSNAVSSQGYLPTGSTLDTSDVLVSLYDPDATPAVVNLSVSTGASLTSPAPFQGVVVPPAGLVVLDLARWAPQISSLGVAATAVSGAVVLGALESTSQTLDVASGSGTSHRIRAVHFTGGSLLVGPGRGFGAWVFAGGPEGRGATTTYDVFNPGSKAVMVSVAPPGRSGAAAALTADVAPGGVVDFATPVAPGRRLLPGPVTISAVGAMPVVAARVTTLAVKPTLDDVNAVPGTGGPSEEWLVPGSSVARRVGVVVTLANPGVRATTVSVVELADLAVGSDEHQVVELPAGSQVAVHFRSYRNGSSAFAVKVSAAAPILVDQRLTPRLGATSSVGGIPVVP